MLVEDNKINQEIILGLLENSGILIDLASNGKEAVDKFRENAYELILMDIQMPVMDGYEASKLIRVMNGDIPIIALTANAMKEDIEKTKNTGMNEHLNKPIEVEKLYATLLKYISKSSELENKKDLLAKDEEELTLPNFITLDSSLGLSHMANNKKLYVKVLHDFYNDYKDVNLENLNSDELIRISHTIKGLSANIGAITLSNVAKEIESTQNKDLFFLFYKELKKVCDELSTLQIKTSQRVTLAITDEKKDALFSKLKESLASKRGRQMTPILEELENSALNDVDKNLVNAIKKLVENRNYKEALEHINNGY